MYSKLSASLAVALILQYDVCFALPHEMTAVLEAHRALGITNFENATVHPPRGGAAVCVSGIVQVQAMTTKNLKFDYVSPQNQSQVAELTLDMLTVNSSFIEDIVIGTQSVNGTFGIGATLCLPTNSRRPAQVQFLTHGFGFDRYYWDFASGYSWVDVAAQYDHATFFYDRLGVGESDTPGALDVVQAPLQVEIAHQLVERLKSGHFGIAFPTVVGVGHSLGSAITQGLTSQYPADLDATILTGFSLDATGQGIFLSGLNLDLASANAPHRFASAPPGYLVSSSVISNQIAFFRAPGFDPAILDLVEATKATGTVGEFFSLGSVIVPAVQYDRPVAIINGVNDLPFCFGNCNYPTNLAQGILPVLYPSSTKTGTYLAQAAGHGLNQHFSASKAYHYAQKFLAQVL